MKKILAAILLALTVCSGAFAQTSPNLRTGQVPTAAQWNNYFIAKQDVLGYVPLNSAGGVVTGRLITSSVPNGISAGLNLTPGSAPPSPVNGDLWMTSGGLFAQVSGVTIGPFSTGAAGSFAGTSPITVSFPAGVTTYACATCGVTGSPLSQFAATTSAQLAGVISDETGTGALVFAGSPTLTGTLTGGAANFSGAVVVSSASASALAVGPTGTTNSALNIDASTASLAAGLNIKGAVTGGTVALSVTDPAANSNISINAKGTGTIAIGSVSTGAITLSRATTISGALTYGGVTFANTVTGSGNLVGSISPTITGHMTVEGVTVTGATGTGNMVFATSPSVSGLTVTGSFTATGLVTNANLVNPSTTVNGQVCTLGSTCTISASAGTITVGTTLVAGGTTGRVLFDNGGTLGEYVISGSGSVAMTTSPAFTTPNIGAATATSINGLTVTASTGTLSITNLKTFAATNSITVSGTDGKTLTVSNSLGFSGTDGQTFAFPNGSDTVVTLTASQTLTNKTLTSPVMTTPSIGVATGTSLALNGCTIGANAFCTTGSVAISSTVTSAAHTITSASASALAVGLNGATNPAFVVDSSTALQAAGLKVTGAASGGTVAIVAIDSGSNTSVTINAKGTGTIGIGTVSTGAVTITPNVTHTGTTTLSAALTYGGVTFANTVTGSGSLVGSISPTFTGTLNAAGTNVSGVLAVISNSASALAVGTSGITNSAFTVNSSVGSQASGLRVSGAVTGGTVAVDLTDPGSNTSLTINAKGTGTIGIGTVSTGAVTITPNVTHSGTTTLSAALTYGGVTFANAVTGSGNLVGSTSPTLVTPALGTPSAIVLTNATGLSAAFDTLFGSTQGNIVYRNAAGWVALAPGTAGQFLTTQGAAANPNWSSGGAGTGTVTSVATAGLATGGTITASGTITVTAATKSDQTTGSSNAVAITPLHQQEHASSVKAWVDFTGSGSNGAQSIGSSYNVTSVTRTGTGQYTIAFTTSFASARFVCHVTANNTTTNIAGYPNTLAVGSVTTQFITLSPIALADPTNNAYVSCSGNQ